MKSLTKIRWVQEYLPGPKNGHDRRRFPLPPKNRLFEGCGDNGPRKCNVFHQEAPVERARDQTCSFLNSEGGTMPGLKGRAWAANYIGGLARPTPWGGYWRALFCAPDPRNSYRASGWPGLRKLPIQNLGLFPAAIRFGLPAGFPMYSPNPRAPKKRGRVFSFRRESLVAIPTWAFRPRCLIAGRP